MSHWTEPEYYRAEYVEASATPAEATALRRWLVLVLLVALVMLGREVVWRMGFTISQRILDAGLSVVLVAALAGTWASARRLGQSAPLWHGLSGRLWMLTAWVAWMTAWGLLRGNFVNDVLKEAVGFLILVLLALLATNDDVWQALRKPLTVSLYLGLAAILITYRMPGVTTGWEGSADIRIDWAPRNLGTVGYSMRGIAMAGLLLGALGLMQRRTDRWRILQVGGLVVFFVVNVLLFEFRGAVVTLVGLLMVFGLLTPIIRGRLPLGTLVLVVTIGGITFALASRTSAFSHLMTRFGEAQVFDARFSETQAFFQDMGPLDLLVGRGMGGWYNGPYWAPALVYNGQRIWSANHFGILGFVLRGGFPLLLFMLTFVIPILLPKPLAWYQNEYNLTAVVLAPVLLLNMLLNPMIFNPDCFFDFLLWAFCLARFSTPVTEAEQRSPAPLQEISYEY